MTTNQISNLKEYLRYAILQEAIEQIEEDDYDSVELNEARWWGPPWGTPTWGKLFGADGKPVENETTPKVLGPDGNAAEGRPGGILGPDGNPVRVAQTVANKAIKKSAEEQGVRRGNRKVLTQDQLPGVLTGINASMRSLVRNGKLVDGWQKMKETSQLAEHISHFTTSTHTGLRNNGINPDAVLFALHQKFDGEGHLTEILDHLGDRTREGSSTVGRGIRYLKRTLEGTRSTGDKPGQPGIPHPHRVNRLHRYGIKDPSALTAEHRGHHDDQVKAFLRQHGNHVSEYLSLIRG